ncbi:DUF6640 family protein [Granulicella rosea]|uniref:DUF6640 family protein n=1 Tax=Granulicella rosea TaxID=474952 RepID=UPI003CCB77FA
MAASLRIVLGLPREAAAECKHAPPNFGGFVADAVVPATAGQHLRNPRWPPHAKFHNGQTMLMGVFNGSLSVIVLSRFHASPCPCFCLRQRSLQTTLSLWPLLHCFPVPAGPTRSSWQRRAIPWV